MRFDFVTAAKIVFGAGSLKELGSLAAPLGKRALVVTGRNPDRAAVVTDLLKAQNIDAVIFPTNGEPSSLSDPAPNTILAAVTKSNRIELLPR